MYAYDFIRKRYDVGNKLGLFKGAGETALRYSALREEF